MSRIISAIVAIAAVLGILFFGGVQLFVIATIAVTALAAHEFYFAVGRGWKDMYKRIATVLALHIPLIIYANVTKTLEPYMFNITIPFLLYFTFKVLRGPVMVEERNKSIMIPFGMFYVGVLMSYLIRIRVMEKGIYLILFLLVTVWASDAFAYYVGKTIGSNKLIPKVSPNKTVEGSIGGIAGSIMVAYLMGQYLVLGMTPRECIIAGLAIAIAGGIGDLAASLIKREEGIKDFSNIMPGHGGALDRVDSLIFAAPVFFYYLLYIVKI
ncbi:MAG: phosphatidate cytidylyltransferase [Nitrospinae bacterium]|nr:phosphatidate cytidylyltransferase [Nitrospinota bacterium]